MSEGFNPTNGIASGVERTPQATTQSARAEASPAFEVLLERLTARAAELQQLSRGLQAPEELPEAMDAARASLADALVLGNELLEAYRAAQRAGQGAA
jgi:hypothetical protein